MIWVAGEYHSRETWSTYVGQLYTVKQSLESALLTERVTSVNTRLLEEVVSVTVGEQSDLDSFDKQ